MSIICIAKGTATMGCRTTDKDGKVISQTPARWEPNPNGGCVASWTVDPETMEPVTPAEIFGDYQAAEYLSAVLEKLRPTRPVNVPDLAGIIRAAYKSGVDICDHCQDFRCNTCVVNDWKEDPDDE